MGILQKLFGGPKEEAPQKQVESVPEKPAGEDLARQIAGEIVERYTLPAIRFILERGEPGLFDSKAGGTPYLPKNMAWPLDSRGMGMELLAQVDCAALEALPDFPRTGLLQFFFGLDDMFGADLDDPLTQKDFRVFYHETVDRSVTADEVLAKKAQTTQPEDKEYCTPLVGTARMVFSAPETQHISEADFRAWAVFLQKWNDLHGTDFKTPWDYYKATEIRQEFPEPEYKGPCHQLGGYPSFTQQDPRPGQYEDLDVLLFQLDSDMHTREEDGHDLVMWGDCGVANFFISREALKRRDFSRVMYNWDCG